MGVTGTKVVRAGDSGFTNDEAQSMLLVGPLSKGIRITLSDSGSGNPNDDILVVVVESAIATGEQVCISTLEFSSSAYGNRKVSAHYSRVNGLNGKVSRVEFYKPTRPDYTTDVAKWPYWGSQFSEEQGISDNARDEPIVGVWCSTNYCDSKVSSTLRFYGNTKCISLTIVHCSRFSFCRKLCTPKQVPALDPLATGQTGFRR